MGGMLSNQTAGQINNGPTHIEKQIVNNVSMAHKEQINRVESSNISEPVSSYVEEEEFIKDLHCKIQKNIREQSKNSKKSIRNYAWSITGVAGSGKTEIARAYVHKYKKDYGHCIWIDASTFEKANKSFQNVFKTERPGNITKGNAFELYKLIFVKQCLIVFDNMDYDLHEKNLLPKALKTDWKEPAIIITSRDRRWVEYTTKTNNIVPNPFSDDRCLKLLENGLLHDSINSDSANTINKLCDGLPLAIQQVIVVIKSQTEINRFSRSPTSFFPCKIQDFLKNFHDQSKNYVTFVPLKSSFEVPYPSNVYKIFSMSLESLPSQKYRAVAIKCLNIMCMLHPDHISIDLIVFLLKPQPAMAVTCALNLLHNYNLITFCDRYCKIHPVIQLVIFTKFVTKLKYGKLINYEDWNKQKSLTYAFYEKFTQHLKAKTNPLPVEITNQPFEGGLELAFWTSVKPEFFFHPSLHLKCLAAKLTLYHELHSHMFFISEMGVTDAQKIVLNTFKYTHDDNNNNLSYNIPNDDKKLLREIPQLLKKNVQFVMYDKYKKLLTVKNWIDKVSKPDSQLIFSSEDKPSSVSEVFNKFSESAMSEENIEFCGALALLFEYILNIKDDSTCKKVILKPGKLN